MITKVCEHCDDKCDNCGGWTTMCCICVDGPYDRMQKQLAANQNPTPGEPCPEPVDELEQVEAAGPCDPVLNRVPMCVDPEQRERLRSLLINDPRFHAVGYSEFLRRAIDNADLLAANTSPSEAQNEQATDDGATDTECPARDGLAVVATLEPRWKARYEESVQHVTENPESHYARGYASALFWVLADLHDATANPDEAKAEAAAEAIDQTDPPEAQEVVLEGEIRDNGVIVRDPQLHMIDMVPGDFPYGPVQVTIRSIPSGVRA